MQEQQIKISVLFIAVFMYGLYGKAIDYMDIRLKELLLRCFFIRKWSCDSFDISVISKEILIKDNRASVRIFVFLLRSNAIPSVSVEMIPSVSSLMISYRLVFRYQPSSFFSTEIFTVCSASVTASVSFFPSTCSVEI